MKPIKRSRLRIFLGKKYYRMKRYIDWHFKSKKYSSKIEPLRLEYKVFEHRTPLLRKLKDVDMWLQHNKIKNLQIATKNIDGILIYPRETFSYWRLIGKPTKRKGYVEGMNLFYGGFRPEIGGGLCQLSNLIYWMTIHSELDITERYRHSYDVFPDANRTQPFGSGATCVYNYRDLQITNNTQDIYQIKVYLTDEHLVGEIWTSSPTTRNYEVYEKDHKITHEYWGGYIRHNSIYRKVYGIDSGIIDDEFITENHAIMMYQPFLREGNQQ